MSRMGRALLACVCLCACASSGPRSAATPVPSAVLPVAAPPAAASAQGKPQAIAPAAQEGLHLQVFVRPSGFSVSTAQPSLVHACIAQGDEVSIPLKDGAPDFAALTRCALFLKEHAQENEEQVSIRADPAVEYGIIIKTLDALRQAPQDAQYPLGKVLFPEVSFRIGR